MAEDKRALCRALGQKEEKRRGRRKATELPAGLPEAFSSTRALSLSSSELPGKSGREGKSWKKQLIQHLGLARPLS